MTCSHCSWMRDTAASITVSWGCEVLHVKFISYCTVRFRNTHRNIILHVYINCTEAFKILSFYIILTTSSRRGSYEEYNKSREIKR
jgi:hypothetical protein